jgi:hypothetical protein
VCQDRKLCGQLRDPSAVEAQAGVLKNTTRADIGPAVWARPSHQQQMGA